MEAALQIRHDIDQAIQTYGRDRIGIVLGTSTSGIDEASQGLARYVREQQFPADYDYQQQELGAPANFLADWLQLSGPAYVISTACTSSARALMSAQRLLDLGVCDVVLCGGVDTLCKLTLNGFSALEAVSGQRCNPFSVNRNGINIGEAAVLFLMSKQPGDSPADCPAGQWRQFRCAPHFRAGTHRPWRPTGDAQGVEPGRTTT